MARDDSKPRKDGKGSRHRGPRLTEESIERIKNELRTGTGYKRPPKHTRFKKGQSGNPRGRPKKDDPGMGDARSIDALVLKQAERRIAVREGEKIKEIPAIEAVLLAQYVSASKGNSHAQRHIIERYERAERARRRRIEAEIAIWESYISKLREAIAEAERNGEPPPEPLPHPDDVVIDHETGVRFIGPLHEEDVRRVEQTCRMRDVLFMQYALDRRQSGKPECEDPLDEPGSALLHANMFNRSVPKRFRVSDDKICVRLLDYDCVPKRQLFKDVYQGWRSLGVKIPRGRTFPPLRTGIETAGFFAELVRRFDDGHLDVDGSTLEELAAKIEAVFWEWKQAKE